MQILILFALIVLSTISINEAFAEIPDAVYKDHVYSIKAHYYDLANALKNGIISAENTLSVTAFENSEAKKKIDTAWNIRQVALESHEGINFDLKVTESYLKSRMPVQSYNKLLQIEQNSYSLKEDLYAIVKEVKNAQILEKQYQENKKTCVLFWCYVTKDTYSGIDSKISDLESKLKTIESKLSIIKSDKNNINQSIHKYEIADKNLEIKKLENLRKQEQYQAEQELRNQQYQAEQERQRLEEQSQRELQQKELQRQQENQQLQEEKQLEIEKQDVIKIGEWSPLVRGIIKGQLNYYVVDLPSYSDSNVRNNVESLAKMMNGMMVHGVTLNRVYSYSNADLTIDWSTDYQEGAIGRQIGNYLLIGLGTTGCDGTWKPFNGQTVYKIMWHEVGHAMGFAHSKDPTNIMYEKGTGNDFSIDYDKTINLKDGWWQKIPFCDGSGTYSYSLESDSKYTGFTVFAVPPDYTPEEISNGDGKVYSDCGGENYVSFSSECTVDTGAYLFIYNPSDTIVTSMNIHIKIVDLTDESPKDMNWDNDYQFFTSQQLDYYHSLFPRGTNSR